MADPRPGAKNPVMFPTLLAPTPRQPWLWNAPYLAVGIFALAMLVITGLLQWREHDTAKSALEGDMHWAERTLENRLFNHLDFLGELGREQEFMQLGYETFQVKASKYVSENPEIQAIIWVDTEGYVEWVAPNESTATFVGERLAGVRWTALQEALRIRREVVSGDYPDHDLKPLHDIIVPVRRGSADIGAFVALQSLETLLRASLPTAFTTRYSLAVVDPQQRLVYSNTSVKPSDRQISGRITLNLPNNRLGLEIVAYRGSNVWLTVLPTLLIVVLTAITSVTLLQLRRHARRRAETEEQLRAAYAFRQDRKSVV